MLKSFGIVLFDILLEHSASKFAPERIFQDTGEGGANIIAVSDSSSLSRIMKRQGG
jgi:hypothetical protein